MSQLGDALSDERRRQGKSIVDVEAATRIRARMLEALERGDYDQLPAPAYVKGYIQSYAGYLDIPVQPLLEMFRADQRFADERAEERERPLMPRGAGYSKVSRQSLEELPADTVVPKHEQVHAIPTRTWLIAAAGIVGVLLLFWALSRLFAQPAAVPPVPPSVQTTSTPEATSSVAASSTAATGSTPVTPVAPTSTPDGATKPTPSAESTANIKPFKLAFRIRAGEKSQLKVTVDGAVLFNEQVGRTADIPSFTVYRSAVVVIAKPLWVTTLKDGVRIPTPNDTTSYMLTVKNTNPPQ